MRKRSLYMALPAAVMAAGLASAQGPDTWSLSKDVGVVDTLQVLNAYAKFIDGQAALKRMNDEFKAAMDQEVQQIQQLELDIMALEDGTQEHRLKTLELELAQRKVQGLGNVHQAKMNSAMARLNVETYDDVFKAVESVAKAKGLKLVLRKRAELPNMPEEFKISDNDRRTILFVDPELDITQDVIDTLKVAKEGDGR